MLSSGFLFRLPPDSCDAARVGMPLTNGASAIRHNNGDYEYMSFNGWNEFHRITTFTEQARLRLPLCLFNKNAC